MSGSPGAGSVVFVDLGKGCGRMLMRSVFSSFLSFGILRVVINLSRSRSRNWLYVV